MKTFNVYLHRFYVSNVICNHVEITQDDFTSQKPVWDHEANIWMLHCISENQTCHAG